MDISPNSKIIVSDGEDGFVKIWHQNSQLIKTIKGYSERVNTVKFSPDGKIIATAGEQVIKL
ncbi:MAG: hypothetical protein HRU34_10905 [Richelia sp.]|nr:hypothetical protein [Richelia sp.]